MVKDPMVPFRSNKERRRYWRFDTHNSQLLASRCTTAQEQQKTICGFASRRTGRSPSPPRRILLLRPTASNGVRLAHRRCEACTITSSRSVNLRGQITELDVFRSGAALVDRSYTYDFTSGTPGPNDPGPNLDRVVDHLLPAESRFYFYDALDRLEKATDLSGTALHEYAHDAVGNRTSTTSGAGTTSYAYESGTDRLDASTGASALDYAHDAHGSRIYQGTAAYAGTPSLVYDESNRLVAVKDPAAGFATIATYTYDAFGRRVKKVADGVTTLFFYDTEGRLVSEIAKHAGPADDAWRFYVFLEDELVGVVDDVAEVGASTLLTLPGRSRPVAPSVAVVLLFAIAGIGVVIVTRRVPAGLATTTSGAALLLLCAQSGGGTPHFAWVHVDPLGTSLAATSSPVPYAAAQVIWRASYEPFGKATVDEDPDGDSVDFAMNVRLPGQYEDAETGSRYNFYRYYEPATRQTIPAT
ncbi:MAG: hypothetical protein DCC71_15285 [Proteobacteria bacterium]|nr:MAG: hypothetical protein DCC71_15285 [Pseudomonadota bacterium]